MTEPLGEELNLPLLLFIPYRFVETAVLARLKEHGHDIPLNQARVFQRINPEGSRMAELAAAAQLSKQTVGSIVDQLEGNGYVRRVRDPQDARGRLVTITAKGQAAIELTIPLIRQIQADWESHLGHARTRQLRDILESLREITDPFATPDASTAPR